MFLRPIPVKKGQQESFQGMAKVFKGSWQYGLRLTAVLI
jgi:hypothetical protein